MNITPPIKPPRGIKPTKETASKSYNYGKLLLFIFSELSEKVTSAREKIHAVKENLNACKQLLRCKREELLNLWLEGIEHKQVLHLLKDVTSDSYGRMITGLTEPELLPSNISHDTSNYKFIVSHITLNKCRIIK
ncbi:Exocyst complex component 4 [Trachymyrmex cornetzi]|uniref:Exocyst complex component Sec8 n=1 Tax=Trachymyrmex cornetzi TaxID=471704 RepID=A0A151JR38_9HYME|nr:Exocyst complex component 4 [Trachymyrmex cornetzi]